MEYITKDTDTYASKILNKLLAELGFDSIHLFQAHSNLTEDEVFGPQSYKALYSQLLKVVPVDFEGFYFRQGFEKNQIVWHHSAGWDNARSMFQWWKVDKRKHVATSIGISDDGTIYKGYDESYWAYHLGLNSRVLSSFKIPLATPYGYHKTLVERHSVAVEVCNWGQLTEKDGEYYSWANAKVDPHKVVKLDTPFRGQSLFEAYTEEELNSLKCWTLLMAIRFDIPLTNSYDQMFKLNPDALKGVKGLYTHCSFRADKTDLSPQKGVLKLMEELNSYHL